MADERRGLAGYASPALRWAMLLEDHPTAKVTYGTQSADDGGIPEDWRENCQGLVTASIDFGDGREPITAWKEVPETEWIKGKKQDFEKNPENLVKLRTQALGRALKQAGYPDGIDDLRPLITWRRRLLELQAVANGRELPPAPPIDEALPASGLPTPDADREDVLDVESTEETIAQTPPWPDELVQLTAQMPADIQAEVWAFASGRNITPASDEKDLRKLIAFARPKVPKVASQKPVEAPAAPEPPSEAPQTLEEAAQPGSGESDGNGEPDPVDVLLDRYEALDKAKQDEVDEWMSKELITWADLNSDDELYNRVLESVEAREPATSVA
jgi:hypothetical protein